MNDDIWHSSLQDKVCGDNPQTATKIREEFIVNVGYHLDMKFNSSDRVYLFWDKGITFVNTISKKVTNISLPLNSERDYRLHGDFLNESNQCIMSGFYTKKNDSSQHSVIFFIDEYFNFTDITPVGYDDGKQSFKAFFYHGNIFIAVGIYDPIINKFNLFRLLKFSTNPDIQLIEDNPIDIYWAFALLSQDNYIWSYNGNTRDDPSKIIFSFDGTNYKYYGPGVAQNGPNASYAIDSNNIFIGYMSGVVWQYDSGTWIKHAITKEQEPGYSVGEIWGCSKDNVFIAGSGDVFNEQNFAYHYDGACWTRWYKRDGHIKISHIWGTPDGSVVLALDDEGNLFRLHVEQGK